MREEKQLLLDEIKEKITGSKAMIFTSYNALSPMMSWGFSNSLRKSESEFEVVKKRIFLKAANECGYEVKLDDLKGHIGIIFVNGDAFDATKVVFNFSKDNDNRLQVLRGEIEGISYDASQMKALSTLPSLNQMRAEILGLLEAPMSQTLAVMDSLLTSVIHCIEQKTKK